MRDHSAMVKLKEPEAKLKEPGAGWRIGSATATSGRSGRRIVKYRRRELGTGSEIGQKNAPRLCDSSLGAGGKSRNLGTVF